MYRNSAVLDAAKLHPCMSCHRWSDTVVAAHSNSQRHGKGRGIKAHDCFVAYMCHRCHTFVDQSKASGELREKIWMIAHRRSVPLFWDLLDSRGQLLLIEDGSLAEGEHEQPLP